jgi:DNA-binding NtrC family response regulator
MTGRSIAMENQMTETAHSADIRSSYVPHTGHAEHAEIHALRIPVGTNLADVERWMIYATLKKCGGNKTRAAALLGVSLKTLYNRLNAYRADGVVMDEGLPVDNAIQITGLHGELTEVSE